MWNYAEIVEQSKAHTLVSWSAQGAWTPIPYERAEGVYVWDMNGKRYLDWSSQLVNVNIGHSHPHVIQAIQEQVAKLTYVEPSGTTEPRARLGALLAEITPGTLTKTLFSNGGTDGIENAMKAARLFTGRPKILTRYRSYHGGTFGAATAGGDPRRLANEPGIPGIVRFPDPYSYRSPAYRGRTRQTNKVMETSQRGLFAIGDITGPPLLAHKASHQGLLVVSHIAGKETTPMNYQSIPAATYCSPQVASMGLTQEDTEKRGYKTRIGKFPLIANSKAIIDDEYEDGFLKIISDDKHGEILGVHAIGSNVSELMWGMSLSKILEGTAFELANTIFPHPTLSEAILEAAHAIVDRPIHM